MSHSKNLVFQESERSLIVVLLSLDFQTINKRPKGCSPEHLQELDKKCLFFRVYICLLNNLPVVLCSYSSV